MRRLKQAHPTEETPMRPINHTSGISPTEEQIDLCNELDDLDRSNGLNPPPRHIRLSKPVDQLRGQVKRKIARRHRMGRYYGKCF
jgi:hypothetical protein